MLLEEGTGARNVDVVEEVGAFRESVAKRVGGLARDLGLRGVRTADWTNDIAQFWPAVIASSLRPQSLLGASARSHAPPR